MKTMVIALGILAAAWASPLRADERTAYYEDASGATRVRLTLRHPTKNVNLGHFRAVGVSYRGQGGQVQALSLTASSLAELESVPGSETSGVAADLYGDQTLDLDGVTAEFGVEQVGSCGGALAFSYTGTVAKGGSFYAYGPAMTVISVLSTVKGEADLYLFDAVGTLLCSSTMTAGSKIADQCGGISTSCDSGTVFYSFAHGLKKRNVFRMDIWVTVAY